MSAEETIGRFTEQFAWEPVVENAEKLRAYDRSIVCGMGGSQLGPMLVEHFGPVLGMLLHRDYGLPEMAAGTDESAFVMLSSYSGETEETLDAGREALARGLPAGAVSTGGRLLEYAREHELPAVVIPETGLQPRLAIGYSMLAVSRLLCDGALETRIREAGRALDAHARKSEGLALAGALQGKVPLVYCSAANRPIAYIWKIKLNETSKIPAFANVFPELCHNELNGFDLADSTRPLSAAMHVVLLEDESDNSRTRKRMKVTREILEERGIAVSRVMLEGEGFGKALDAAVLADWVSYSLAGFYGVPDEATPLIVEFKKRIAP